MLFGKCGTLAALIVLGAISAVLGKIVREQKKSLRASSSSEEPFSAFVVDCGSGKTRVYRFAMSSVHEGYATMKLQSGDSLAPLAESLLIDNGKSLAENIANIIQTEFEGNLDMPVLLGATGGVREAVDSGTITHDNVKAFEIKLKEKGFSAARFRLLTGEEEAELELRGAKYVARKALPLQNVEFDEDTGVSVISAGGMSAQIAADPHRLSLRLDATRVGKRILESWIERGGEEAAKELRAYNKDVMHKVEACAISRGTLGGTFVGVEMFGYFGTGESSMKNAGIFPDVSPPGVLISKQHALDTVNAFVRQWESSTQSTSGAGKTWRDVSPAVTAVELKHMLSLLSDNTKLSFGREFEVAKGVKLRGNWALGLFLAEKEKWR